MRKVVWVNWQQSNQTEGAQEAMNTLELIDPLCAVTAAQADIIREQAYFIENCKTIDEEVKKHFADQRGPVDAELDLLEIRLRPIHNTACRKEDGNGSDDYSRTD